MSAVTVALETYGHEGTRAACRAFLGMVAVRTVCRLLTRERGIV